MRNQNMPWVSMAIFGLAAIAPAQLYSEDFEVDHTANWQFNSSIAGDTRNNGSGGEANFFFDYSAIGIPAAPNGTGTHGLKMEANVPGTGVFSGMSASPLGLNSTTFLKVYCAAGVGFPTGNLNGVVESAGLESPMQNADATLGRVSNVRPFPDGVSV